MPLAPPGYTAQRLESLHLRLPEPPLPRGPHRPWIRQGQMLLVAGQIPEQDGEPRFVGKLGRDLLVEDGRKALRHAGLLLLAQIAAALDGDLDRVRRMLRLGVALNCMPDFGQQHEVASAASELFLEVLEEDRGQHVLTVTGVHCLPGRASVQIEAMLEVQP